MAEQYSTDLLKLNVFARSLLLNEEIDAYLSSHHQEIREQLQSVVFAQ